MTKLEQLHLFLKFHFAPDSDAKQEVWKTCCSNLYTEDAVREICANILLGDTNLSDDEIKFLNIVANPSRLVAGQTDQQWAERMAATSSDPEAAHADADRLLANLVLELGYPLTAQAWQNIDKWYA